MSDNNKVNDKTLEKGYSSLPMFLLKPSTRKINPGHTLNEGIALPIKVRDHFR